MSVYYYLGPDDEKYGPATVELLNQWAIQGRITNDSWVYVDDTDSRIWVTEIEGFVKAPPIHSATLPPKPAKPKVPVPFVESHLFRAIFSTCFCCLPFGLIAIVYAVQVDGHRMRGDIESAREASKNALAWANAGMVASVFSLLLYLLVRSNSH